MSESEGAPWSLVRKLMEEAFIAGATAGRIDKRLLDVNARHYASERYYEISDAERPPGSAEPPPPHTTKWA